VRKAIIRPRLGSERPASVVDKAKRCAACSADPIASPGSQSSSTASAAGVSPHCNAAARGDVRIVGGAERQVLGEGRVGDVVHADAQRDALADLHGVETV
jgi:hypothetical protein